jgi:hypothetical protein
MIFIAKGFVEHNNEKHGDLPLLLICDNLKPHLNPKVKWILSEAKIFLFCIPPKALLKLCKPNDAAYLGRLLCSRVRQFLDQGLMEEDNLALWEGQISAAQRRVLMTYLVTEAMDEYCCVKNDSMRVGCFVRTGCLMERTKTNSSDDIITSQGLSSKVVVPDSTDDTSCHQPFEDEGPATRLSSGILHNLRSAIACSRSLGRLSLVHGKVNHTNSTKIQLRDDAKLSNE